MVPLTLSLVEAHLRRIEAMTQHHREKSTDARNHEVILNDLIAATEVYTLNSYNAFQDLMTLSLFINATLHLAPHTAPPPLASLEALFRRHLAAEAQNAETRSAGLDLRARHATARHHHDTVLSTLELHNIVLEAVRTELISRGQGATNTLLHDLHLHI